jgi:hypothetical protein
MYMFSQYKMITDALFYLRCIVSELLTYKNGLWSVHSEGRGLPFGQPCCLEPGLHLLVLAR